MNFSLPAYEESECIHIMWSWIFYEPICQITSFSNKRQILQANLVDLDPYQILKRKTHISIQNLYGGQDTYILWGLIRIGNLYDKWDLQGLQNINCLVSKILPRRIKSQYTFILKMTLYAGKRKSGWTMTIFSCPTLSSYSNHLYRISVSYFSIVL